MPILAQNSLLVSQPNAADYAVRLDDVTQLSFSSDISQVSLLKVSGADTLLPFSVGSQLTFGLGSSSTGEANQIRFSVSQGGEPTVRFALADSMTISIVSADPTDHEYVDLGLPSGTLWAKTNLGADRESETGYLYNWASTVECVSSMSQDKTPYILNYQSSHATLTKYNWSSNYSDSDHPADNLRTLCASDDPATAKWCNGWRTPTAEEVEELIKYSSWTYEVVEGVEGYRACSKSDASKSVFFPICYYWTSSISPVDPLLACGLRISAGVGSENIKVDYSSFIRQNSFPVRAVRSVSGSTEASHFLRVSSAGADVAFFPLTEQTVVSADVLSRAAEPEYEYVDLGLPSGTLWAKKNVGAANETDHGSYYAWGETSTKPEDKYDEWKDYNPEKGSSADVLEPSADAATVNWGKEWRMPTAEEFKELYRYCKWTPSEDNNRRVYYKVSSKTDPTKYIIIPSGRKYGGKNFPVGFYWTSSRGGSQYGKAFNFWEPGQMMFFEKPGVDKVVKLYGMNVRPVRAERKK